MLRHRFSLLVPVAWMRRLLFLLIPCLIASCNQKPAPIAPAGDLCKEVAEGRTHWLDRELERWRLGSCDVASLGLIRNTIFARHGYRFSTHALAAHFRQFGWYRPDDVATKQIKAGALLSAIDKKNVQIVGEVEREKQKLKARSTEVQPDSEAVAALVGRRFLVSTPGFTLARVHLCANGTAHYEKTDIPDPWVWIKHGTWSSRGSTVSFRWTREDGTEGYGEIVGCAGGGPCNYKNYRPFDRKIDEDEDLDIDLYAWQEGANKGIEVEGAADGCDEEKR